MHWQRAFTCQVVIPRFLLFVLFLLFLFLFSTISFNFCKFFFSLPVWLIWLFTISCSICLFVCFILRLLVFRSFFQLNFSSFLSFLSFLYAGLLFSKFVYRTLVNTEFWTCSNIFKLICFTIFRSWEYFWPTHYILPFLSGIMAILFCGIVMSQYTHYNLSPGQLHKPKFLVVFIKTLKKSLYDLQKFMSRLLQINKNFELNPKKVFLSLLLIQLDKVN